MTGSRPTRSTVAGAAYLDLQALARRQHRPTDELHQLYALEGFLTRLAASSYADRLVLKGGVLLAAYDARRPTRDVDMQARAVSDEQDAVLALVRDVAAVDLDDGLLFHLQDASAEVIRAGEDYSGVRVTLSASLATARLSLHVDVSVGDPVWPPPRSVALPRLLGGTLHVIGYPLAMVYAEKIATALHRGTVNTRWRDFADLYLLASRQPADADELRRALDTVAAHRSVVLEPLAVVLAGYPALAQARWLAWRRKQHLEDRLPPAFADLMAAVAGFADPVLTGAVAGHTWDPGGREWRR